MGLVKEDLATGSAATEDNSAAPGWKYFEICLDLAMKWCLATPVWSEPEIKQNSGQYLQIPGSAPLGYFVFH